MIRHLLDPEVSENLIPFEAQQNGEKERVLKAVRRGHSTIPEIVQRTGLARSAVQTYLLRLRGEGLVKRDPQRRVTCYVAINKVCLLANVF